MEAWCRRRSSESHHHAAQLLGKGRKRGFHCAELALLRPHQSLKTIKAVHDVVSVLRKLVLDVNAEPGSEVDDDAGQPRPSPQILLDIFLKEKTLQVYYVPGRKAQTPLQCLEITELQSTASRSAGLRSRRRERGSKPAVGACCVSQ
jgi:hypothetical protein